VHSPARVRITVEQAGEEWVAEAEADGLERVRYRQHLHNTASPRRSRSTSARRSAKRSSPTYRSPASRHFRSRLIREGRSRIMAKEVLSILGNAMEGGRVPQNIVRGQTLRRRREAGPDQRHKKRIEVGVDTPTKDEILAMLAQAQGWVRLLIVTAIFTTLRASELRGLRWGRYRFLTPPNRRRDSGSIARERLAPRSQARRSVRFRLPR
jgi:integrase